MGALNGTLSYKLFYVQDDVPSGFKQDLVERVNHFAFEKLTPEDDEDERFGWVILDRPLHTNFDLYSILYNHFINLGLRRDKYVIPSSMFKAHFAEAEREYLRANDKKKLSKNEKDDLKAIVRTELKSQFLPRMKIIDMSWDLNSGRVRLWSQSNRICEFFQGFFEDTFQLKLLPANPYINATELDLSEPQLARLAEVESSNFVRPAVDEAAPAAQ